MATIKGSDCPCFVSPAEPDSVRRLLGDEWVQDRELTEDYGVDFSWIRPDGEFVGVQRKQFPGDFLSSLNADDRLAKEAMQMQRLADGGRLLLLEGRPAWGDKGELVGQWRDAVGVSRWRLRGLVWSLQMVHGVMTEWTDDIQDTVRTLLGYREWSVKDGHEGLSRRGAKPNGVSWLSWIWQSFPSIGAVTARELEQYGDRHGGSILTLRDDVDLEDVPGVSQIRAGQIRKVLGLPMRVKKARGRGKKGEGVV